MHHLVFSFLMRSFQASYTRGLPLLWRFHIFAFQFIFMFWCYFGCRSSSRRISADNIFQLGASRHAFFLFYPSFGSRYYKDLIMKPCLFYWDRGQVAIPFIPASIFWCRASEIDTLLILTYRADTRNCCIHFGPLDRHICPAEKPFAWSWNLDYIYSFFWRSWTFDLPQFLCSWFHFLDFS